MSLHYSKDLTRESRLIPCSNLSIGRSASDCEFKFDWEELEEINVVINPFQLEIDLQLDLFPIHSITCQYVMAYILKFY